MAATSHFPLKIKVCSLYFTGGVHATGEKVLFRIWKDYLLKWSQNIIYYFQLGGNRKDLYFNNSFSEFRMSYLDLLKLANNYKITHFGKLIKSLN
jgi:hypothetical protein